MTRRRLLPHQRPHHFNLRVPRSTWQRLGEHAAREHLSINSQIVRFIEAELLDSPTANGHPPSDALPWVEVEQ